MKSFHFLLPALLTAWPALAAATPPVALDGAHRCQYPTVGGGADDKSFAVAFTVMADGSVGSIAAVTPSRDPLVDHVARRCAGAWRYKPATRNGKPVEHGWRETIVWDVTPFATISTSPSSDAAPAAARPLRFRHECTGYYPQAAIDAHAEGSVTLSFTVTTEGATKDHKIVVSSGNAALDEATIKCVSRWGYKPMEKDGVPVEASWQASMTWRLPGSGD